MRNNGFKKDIKPMANEQVMNLPLFFKESEQVIDPAQWLPIIRYHK